MRDSEIRDFINTLNNSETAAYTEYETKILSGYNGCSDSKYSDLFLTKLWAKFAEIYAQHEDFESVSLFLTNSIGSKILKYVPKNTEVVCLNNDFYCYVVSRAILQHTKLDTEPMVSFGSLADYFYMGYDKFASRKYDIVVNTYEEDNAYYKSIDNGEEADLPYFLYCFKRSLLFADKYICSIMPNSQTEVFKAFLNKIDKVKQTIISDVDYTAFLIQLY